MRPNSRFAIALTLAALSAATWLMLHGVGEDNTLRLAAQGKIDLNIAWAYRFRSAAWFAHPGNTALLAPMALTGAAVFFGLLVLLQAGLLYLQRGWICLVAALVLPLVAVFAPAALTWSAMATAVIFAGKLRNRLYLALPLLLLAAYCAALGYVLANPFDHVARQRTLGGISYRDSLAMNNGEKANVSDDCLAAINPHDLRAISSLERLQLKSLQKFAGIVVIDLKAVEDNYRLLTLRGQDGAFVFSEQARAYADAEKRYAATQWQRLLSASRLCLIANFDLHPQREVHPFTRARQLSEMRRAAGKDTVIIQLPAR